MDPSVITATITAITSVIVGLIGLQAGRNDTAAPARRIILDKQLHQLYAPLESALLLESNNNIGDILVTVKALIGANYPLVPPVILNEYLRLSNLTNPSISDIATLQTTVSSFYNWTRKALGYPYSSPAIKHNLTPVYERNGIIKYSIKFIVLIFWFFCAMALVGMMTGSEANFSEQTYRILSSVTIAGAPWVIISALNQNKSK